MLLLNCVFLSKKQLLYNMFNLRWSDFGEKEDWFFSHPNKTPEEFQVDVQKMMKQYGKEYIDSSEGALVGVKSWVEFVGGKLIVSGYKKLSFETVTFFGATPIEKQDYDEFAEVVGEELFQMAVNHNKSVKKHMEVIRKSFRL